MTIYIQGPEISELLPPDSWFITVIHKGLHSSLDFHYQESNMGPQVLPHAVPRNPGIRPVLSSSIPTTQLSDEPGVVRDGRDDGAEIGELGGEFGEELTALVINSATL